MNWHQFRKNIDRRFQLEPVACYLDNAGNELPEINDDWEIVEISDSDVIHIQNRRTNHLALLGKDHVYDFRSNPARKEEDLEFGFLILKVHIFIQHDKLWLRANSRPGERIIPYPTKRMPPIWTEFVKMDAYSGVPPTARIAKIQFRLWSEYDNLPLMIRIASDAEAKFSQETSGPSGIIDLLLTETQAFYVSLSNPHIQYEISVIGWSF